MLSTSRPVLSAVPTAAHPPRSEAPERLDDGVLLSLVLTSGLFRDDATALGLVARFASPGGVLSADECELRRAGASDHVVDRLREVRELVVRAARNEICDRPVVSSWSQLLAYVRTAIAHLPREQFRALYLDRKNVLIVEEWVADGDVDHAPVYNSGPARVARLGRVPDIRETREYVQSVIACFLALTAGQAVTNSQQCRRMEARL